MADILNAAGVARGSFYFYFPNKHAVLAELVCRAVSSAHEAAGTWANDTSGAPGSALSRGTAEGAALWHEHAPVLRAIVENWQSDAALTQLWTETIDGFTRVAATVPGDHRAGARPRSDVLA